jgi:hypothetical protein
MWRLPKDTSRDIVQNEEMEAETVAEMGVEIETEVDPTATAMELVPETEVDSTAKAMELVLEMEADLEVKASEEILDPEVKDSVNGTDSTDRICLEMAPTIRNNSRVDLPHFGGDGHFKVINGLKACDWDLGH